jgi:uncharacterized membrane protein
MDPNDAGTVTEAPGPATPASGPPTAAPLTAVDPVAGAADPDDAPDGAPAAESGDDDAGATRAEMTDGGDRGADWVDATAAERCAWSLVWIAVVIGGISLWGDWSIWGPSGYLAPTVVVVGMVGLAATWLVASPRPLGFQVSAMVALVASTLADQGVPIHARQYYSTDSAAFSQVAARLLVHGIDPYTAPMGAAAGLLQTPSQYWSYTVDGGYVNHFSYPAGAFLFQVPAMALGFHHQIVDWMDLFAWLVTGILVFVVLPSSVRWVAALVMATPILAGIFASGGTDAAFLPFLVLAVWRWDRFGLGRSAGLARWIGPLALGVACSIKQTPWFFVPFLVTGVFLEARASGRRPTPTALRYSAVAAGTFVAINLPFIVWHPGAWASGTVLPFTNPLVADGQGLVTLALHGITRGVSLPLLVAGGLLVVVALWGAFVVWYPWMKRVWVVLLPLAFFVTPRSLTTYLIDFFPVALVAVVTVAPAGRAAAPWGVGRWRRPYGYAVGAVAAVAVAVVALAFTAVPLELGVRSVATSDAATSLDSVTVSVHNDTGRTLTPRFMVTVGASHPSGYWHAYHYRPVVLSPGGSTVVTLYPSTFVAAPTHGSFWLVVAYTASPEALSVSPPQLWRLGKVK